VQMAANILVISSATAGGMGQNLYMLWGLSLRQFEIPLSLFLVPVSYFPIACFIGARGLASCLCLAIVVVCVLAYQLFRNRRMINWVFQ